MFNKLIKGIELIIGVGVIYFKWDYLNTVNYKNLNFLFNLIIIMEAINIKYSFMDDYSEGSHPKILEKLIKTNLI